MEKISPKYQMSLVKSINDKLFDIYRGYADVEQYILKWHEYDEYGNWENFSIIKKKSKWHQMNKENRNLFPISLHII